MGQKKSNDMFIYKLLKLSTVNNSVFQTYFPISSNGCYEPNYHI